MAERVHLTMVDILRTMVIEGENWNEDINQAFKIVACTIRSTVSTATHYSPRQLACNHDMIMQTAIIVNWELIKSRQ